MSTFRDRISGDVFALVRFLTPPSHPLIYSNGWPLLFLCVCGSALVCLYSASKASTFRCYTSLFLSCSYSPRRPTPSGSLVGNSRKAKSLKQRIGSYFHKGGRHPDHILEMLSQARSLDTTVTRTAIKAALVESDEIKRYAPPYNRALRTNERDVLFFSRDLKSSNPQPDSNHSIGPLPSSYNLNPLILLGIVLNGDLRKTSLKVIEGILDIPPKYLPNRDCFVSGVKAFKQEFHESLHPAFDLATLMSLGAQFWIEKLEERAAEEAAKKETLEKASKKALLEESATKDTLSGITIKQAGEKDFTGDSEADEILELKMQESGYKEVVDTWTPERIVIVLKSIIRLGAFQIRRSRWFLRLSESSLVWMPVVGDSEVRNVIVFKGGTPQFEDPVSPSETIPLPAGHSHPAR